MLFSNRDLKEMIVPLLLEQLLVMLVGLADTLIVSYAGEAAVSGVALQMGVTGIAVAMVCDWTIRAVIFWRRQKSGKWKTFQVI